MYIGKTPTVGNFQVCDAISVVNGQAAYTLQVGGVNVAPESANHMLVSLNGILQKPGSSFTISSSTITFASNLATGDVIDFVQILGNVLDIGAPSDDTVTAAKLNNDIISGTTALTAEPADTDEFLVSDAGTLKRIDYSLIKGGGITVADHWRLTASIAGTDAVITTSNIEQADTNMQGNLGASMSYSSGIFTFPSTGFYLILFKAATDNDQGDETQFVLECQATSNNSSYDTIAQVRTSARPEHNNQSAMGSTIVDVTDTANRKVRFATISHQANTNLGGSTSQDYTSFTFIRLGDT